MFLLNCLLEQFFFSAFLLMRFHRLVLLALALADVRDVIQGLIRPEAVRCLTITAFPYILLRIPDDKKQPPA
jgi:hypothetical protein